MNGIGLVMTFWRVVVFDWIHATEVCVQFICNREDIQPDKHSQTRIYSFKFSQKFTLAP